ncbi:MAG TPA: response regulator transcription factor [Bacteroidetes bacterium]|nr:response regulator transcription factor [Bacteroidota bacterium]
MKVIIADDSKLIRDRITERVELIDTVNVVAQATNSYETIEEIEKHKPDIILLDIRMPKGSGINVLKHIKKNKIKIVTIVVTNYPIVQYKNKCFELGADYFFS